MGEGFFSPRATRSSTCSELRARNLFASPRPTPAGKAGVAMQKCASLSEESCANLEKLSVALRLRSVTDPSLVDSITINSTTTITMTAPEGSNANRFGDHEASFSFPRVYGPDVDQATFFKEEVSDYVQGMLDKNQDAAIMCYGITAAGKTYTIMGTEADPGILRRAVQRLFGKDPTFPYPGISAGTREAALACFEIHNDDISDLLPEVATRGGGGIRAEKKALKLREAPDQEGVEKVEQRRLMVEGLKQHPLESLEVAEKLLVRADKNRRTASTGSNRVSSRSHAIFTLSLHEKAGRFPPDDSLSAPLGRTLAELVFIDLAGNERASKTGNQGGQLKESGQINGSLMHLTRCLQVLRENQKRRKEIIIPWRECKLTTYLRKHLHGWAKMALIVNARGHPDNYDETLAVIRFANTIQTLCVQPTKAPPPPTQLPPRQPAGAQVGRSTRAHGPAAGAAVAAGAITAVPAAGDSELFAHGRKRRAAAAFPSPEAERMVPYAVLEVMEMEMEQVRAQLVEAERARAEAEEACAEAEEARRTLESDHHDHVNQFLATMNDQLAKERASKEVCLAQERALLAMERASAAAQIKAMEEKRQLEVERHQVEMAVLLARVRSLEDARHPDGSGELRPAQEEDDEPRAEAGGVWGGGGKERAGDASIYMDEEGIGMGKGGDRRDAAGGKQPGRKGMRAVEHGQGHAPKRARRSDDQGDDQQGMNHAIPCHSGECRPIADGTTTSTRMDAAPEPAPSLGTAFPPMRLPFTSSDAATSPMPPPHVSHAAASPLPPRPVANVATSPPLLRPVAEVATSPPPLFRTSCGNCGQGAAAAAVAVAAAGGGAAAARTVPVEDSAPGAGAQGVVDGHHDHDVVDGGDAKGEEEPEKESKAKRGGGRKRATAKAVTDDTAAPKPRATRGRRATRATLSCESPGADTGAIACPPCMESATSASPSVHPQYSRTAISDDMTVIPETPEADTKTAPMEGTAVKVVAPAHLAAPAPAVNKASATALTEIAAVAAAYAGTAAPAMPAAASAPTPNASRVRRSSRLHPDAASEAAHLSLSQYAHQVEEMAREAAGTSRRGRGTRRASAVAKAVESVAGHGPSNGQGGHADVVVAPLKDFVSEVGQHSRGYVTQLPIKGQPGPSPPVADQGAYACELLTWAVDGELTAVDGALVSGKRVAKNGGAAGDQAMSGAEGGDALVEAAEDPPTKRGRRGCTRGVVDKAHDAEDKATSAEEDRRVGWVASGRRAHAAAGTKARLETLVEKEDAIVEEDMSLGGPREEPDAAQLSLGNKGWATSSAPAAAPSWASKGRAMAERLRKGMLADAICDDKENAEQPETGSNAATKIQRSRRRLRPKPMADMAGVLNGADSEELIA
eukprot:jgi/Mesvir1/11872/Mv00218-RA.1